MRLQDARRWLTGSDSWVVDGFYPAVRPLLAERAQVLLWLDRLPRHACRPDTSAGPQRFGRPLVHLQPAEELPAC